MNAVRDEFAGLLTDKLGIPEQELTAEVTFDALGLDSLALIELSVAVQKKFGVVLDEDELTPDHTFSSVVAALESRREAA